MEDYGKIKKLYDSSQKKEFSCEGLTKTYIGATETDNPVLNAYVHFTPETALAAAQEVNAKIARGETLDTLEGIPMTPRDNVSTMGIKTTCGSKTLEDYRPTSDATIWELLRSRGAVLLGKTNMDEFAMGSSNEASIYGGVWSLHNTVHVVGGSSDGVAGAVTGNLVVYGPGTDTGGSIRQSASFHDTVGLKPTYDAVSRYGVVVYASSLDQVGPIATNAGDTTLAYDALAKQDPRDSTLRGARELACGTLKKDIKSMRIGFAKQYFDDVRDEVYGAVERSMQIYRELGAELIETDPPQLSYALSVYYILSCAEASSNLGRLDGIRYGYKAKNYSDVNEMIVKMRSEGLGKEIKRCILLGVYVLSAGYHDAYYKKAQSLHRMLVQTFQSTFEHCDVIAAPTMPMTFFGRGRAAQNTVETYLTDIYTAPISITGIPTLSLLCGFDQKGLPIGLQLIGNSSCEATLLNTAYRFEQATREAVFRMVKMGVR